MKIDFERVDLLVNLPAESQRSDNRELTYLIDTEQGEASICGVAQNL